MFILTWMMHALIPIAAAVLPCSASRTLYTVRCYATADESCRHLYSAQVLWPSKFGASHLMRCPCCLAPALNGIRKERGLAWRQLERLRERLATRIETCHGLVCIEICWALAVRQQFSTSIKIYLCIEVYKSSKHTLTKYVYIYIFQNHTRSP